MVPVMVEAAMATPGHIDTAASTDINRNVFPATRMLGSLVMVPSDPRRPRPDAASFHIGQLRDNRVDWRLRACEHRRIALRVDARFRVPQTSDQVDELLRIIRVER